MRTDATTRKIAAFSGSTAQMHASEKTFEYLFYIENSTARANVRVELYMGSFTSSMISSAVCNFSRNAKVSKNLEEEAMAVVNSFSDFASPHLKGELNLEA